jgi:cation-transporting ATPase 13A3/4/5
MRLAVLLAFITQVACYDGHPEYDFSCPWDVPVLFADDGFCNPICVANVSDCPTELQPSEGFVVCGDGFQYPFNESAGDMDPCNTSFITDLCADNTACGSVLACRRDINTTGCQYAKLMVVNAGCEEDYNYEAGEIISTSLPGFSFVAIFFSLVAGLAIAYTLVNELLMPRGNPVLVKSDEAAAAAEHGENLETKETFQDKDIGSDELLHKTLKDPEHDSTGYVVETGYNVDIMGRLVYGLLILVAIMFQIALIITTISYYAHETEGAWQPIPNYIQGLIWFEITWHVASLFMIALLYPRNLRAIFYRRTPLQEANMVEVWHRTRTEAVLKDVGGPWVQQAYQAMDMFFKYFNLFMGTFICYHDKRVPGAATFCAVSTTAGLRSFTYQLRQFVYDEKLEAFVPAVILLPTTCQELVEKRAGLSTEEAAKRLGFVGPNVIAVPPPSIAKEFTKEFSRGFYIYQTFMVWTWWNFAYYHMGFILAFVFVSGGLSIIWVNYNNARILATLVGQAATVTVLRSGERKTIPSTELVPGDVLEIEPGLNTCDMVLVSGKVVLDESSLTGESMPVAKDAIENRAEKFTTATHKKAIILAGTTTMQGDKQAEPSLAMVLSTGGNSEKGVQIRDILFRETPLFKFNYQVRIVVFILGFVAVACGIGTVALLGNKNPAEAWFYAMYVVASAMPPLLPTVFVVSVGLSANRLLGKQVVCSEPPRLLMAGKVRVACFDKCVDGDLDEARDGLLWGAAGGGECVRRPLG